jgi:hypothetical protein
MDVEKSSYLSDYGTQLIESEMESIRDDVTIVYLIIQIEYYIFGIRFNHRVLKNIDDKVFFTKL